MSIESDLRKIAPELEEGETRAKSSEYGIMIGSAYRQIAAAADHSDPSMGYYDKEVREFRKTHARLLVQYWRDLLTDYQQKIKAKHRKLWNGTKIEYDGGITISAQQIDSMHREGTKYEVERNTPDSRDTFSYVINYKGEVDEVFAPEIHTVVHEPNGAEYIFLVSKGTITHLQRVRDIATGRETRTFQFDPDLIPHG